MKRSITLWVVWLGCMAAASQPAQAGYTYSHLVYNSVTGLGGNAYDVCAAGTKVYAGGDFTTAGGVPANYIAVWDGSSWAALGSGLGGDYKRVMAIAVYNNIVYAGGSFTSAGGSPISFLAQWDGSAWTSLGTGPDNEIYALAVDDAGNLYAGGMFTSMDGKGKTTGIAKWNGSVWSPVGEGLVSGSGGEVSDIKCVGTDVYVSGWFQDVVQTGGGVLAVNHVAKWNGTAWSALGTGLASGDYGICITAEGSNVYVGGVVSYAGGTPALNIAHWNGSVWSAMGSGLNQSPQALTSSGGVVYATGAFTTAGGVSASRIARWSGSSWSAMGAGLTGNGLGISVSQHYGKLFVGGKFQFADGTQANYITSVTDSENPLPVELQSFTGTARAGTVTLRWSTATEVNNAGFELQRKSGDGKLIIDNGQWTSVGFVEGHGTTNAPQSYTFIDKPGPGEFQYRLKQIDRDGKFEYSDIVICSAAAAPQMFGLMQNYPNPFNPTTNISFSVPTTGHARVTVVTVLGQEVAELFNGNAEAGKELSLTFNAAYLPGGVYFCRLVSGGKTEVIKLNLVR